MSDHLTGWMSLESRAVLQKHLTIQSWRHLTLGFIQYSLSEDDLPERMMLAKMNELDDEALATR